MFERCFRQWVASIVGVAEGVVAFDGKTVKGSKDGPNTALHMVSAFATQGNRIYPRGRSPSSAAR